MFGNFCRLQRKQSSIISFSFYCIQNFQMQYVLTVKLKIQKRRVNRCQCLVKRIFCLIVQFYLFNIKWKGKKAKFCTYAMNMSSKYLDLYFFVYICSPSECQGFFNMDTDYSRWSETFHMGGAENMHVFVGIYEYCFWVFTDM